MLKNLNPIITPALLKHLAELHPGQWLAIASHHAPMLERAESISVTGAPDRVAAAVLDLLPLSGVNERPLLYWAVDADTPDLEDLTFALQGLATDAEGRRITAEQIDDAAFVQCGASEVTSVIRVPWAGAPFVFFLCAGGGEHERTDIACAQPLEDLWCGVR